MALVELLNVEKDYPLGNTVIQALRGVTLSVEKGELLSVVGPSGCGKTTLLNMMGCIDTPTRGSVHFGGVDIAAVSDGALADIRLRRIGFIFQTFNLVPVLSVQENVELPMVIARVPAARRGSVADSLIDAVGLTSYRKHKPAELSGGQRQRVAIARALVNDPDVVIADEPTANLDSTTGDEVLHVIRNLNEREGVTFIFSTHNPEILKYATRLIRLRDGSLEGAGHRGDG
ncbi:MAG TPA: ABC transporter ATP-binding protein [Spirochaetia bacterium]|nr:ABC transporter ATP-binding protein [Spirochaetia bacterium]